MENSLTIESAWEILVDGLTVQRYFLHIYPWKRKKFTQIINFREMMKSFVCENTVNIESSNFYKYIFSSNEFYIYKEIAIKTIQKAFKMIENANFSWLLDLELISIYNSKTFELKKIDYVCSINTNDKINKIAEELLLYTSKFLMKEFLLSLNIDRYEFAYMNQIHSNYDFLADFFSMCIKYNFYKRLNEQFFIDEITNIYAYLETNYAMILQVLKQTNHMNIDDLILRYYPNELRFRPYLNGKGAGQL